MIAAKVARRSGITLTEILIAILIMGVGLISLATLFPLGLLRLREATRLGRSAVAARGFTDDTDVRALLYKQSFTNTWYGPRGTLDARDPFVQDTDSTGAWYSTANPLGIGALASGSLFKPHNNLGYDIAGDGLTYIGNLTSGLPFCYDPLWRSLTGVMPYTSLIDPTLNLDGGYATAYSFARNEARFGSGIFANQTPYILGDADGSIASAHGLQRLTNFIPYADPSAPSVLSASANLNYRYNFLATNLFLGSLQPPDVAGNVFTNIDDIVFNPVATRAGAPSSLVPDMSAGTPQADYRFSWFFTGRQVDAGGNGSQFTGDIVVCENRPFSFDPLTVFVPAKTAGDPDVATSVYAPGGETVIEAIYGYGGNAKAVLLRWKSNLPDPPIRVGGWFADTTYERSVATYRTRTGSALTPFARANWYQIAKRTDVVADPTYPTQCRSIVVTLTAPVRTVTPYLASGGFGTPVHVNVACLVPSVINVFPRAFEVH